MSSTLVGSCEVLSRSCEAFLCLPFGELLGNDVFVPSCDRKSVVDTLFWQCACSGLDADIGGCWHGSLQLFCAEECGGSAREHAVSFVELHSCVLALVRQRRVSRGRRSRRLAPSHLLEKPTLEASILAAFASMVALMVLTTCGASPLRRLSFILVQRLLG